ncbi:MAG: hypothetical protein CMB06_01880 [Euryarchaeota archaeon]|nr:hypothetical protein [Euryarchaeota archaeon]
MLLRPIWSLSEILIYVSILILIGYLFMINIIYFLSPNKKWESFPERCKIKTKCTRVADTNNRGYGLKPIEITDSIHNVQKKIIAIINSKPRMKIINQKEGFIHATDVTPFFRFYDDIAIKIFRENDKTKIWMQSQSRLGLHDLGVNEKRIKKLHKEMLLM